MYFIFVRINRKTLDSKVSRQISNFDIISMCSIIHKYLTLFYKI